MRITTKQKASIIQLSLLVLIILAWQFYPYVFPPPNYKFEAGGYTLTMDYGMNNPPRWDRNFNSYIEFKDGEINFHDPLNGDLSFKGRILHNNLTIKYTSIVDESLHYLSYTGKEMKPKQSGFKRTMEFISMGNIDFPVETYLNFSGKLIGDNYISGNFSGIDMQREVVKGTFLIRPQFIKSNRELYPKLPIGNGKGRLVRRFDPRCVEIFFDAEETIKVNDEILDFSALESLVKEQASQYGTDIPIIFCFDRDVKYSQVKKLIKVIRAIKLYRFKIKYFRSQEWDGFTMFSFDDVDSQEEAYPDNSLKVKIEFIKDGMLDVKQNFRFDGECSYTLYKEMRSSIMNEDELKKKMLILLESDSEIPVDFTVDDNLTIQELIGLFDFFNTNRANVVLR